MWQKKILFLCLAGGINAGASEKNNLYDPSSLIPNEHGLDIINYIVQQKEMKDHAQDDIASSKLSSASSSSVSGVAYCNPPKKTPKQSYKQTSNASTTSVLNDAEAVATAKRLAAARALIEQPCLNLSLKILSYLGV